MNNKFDELAKGLARSVTRRQAFKRFGVGLAGMVLACLGLANKAEGGGAAYVCCVYECYTSIFGGHTARTKVCVPGSLCPGPGQFPYCTFQNSHSVLDCKTCTT